MRFLANENFPDPSIKLLREEGHDVKSISEEHRGISDSEVIDMAREDHRIILTFDKDYGELIFKYGKAIPPAVVFFRFKGNDPSFAGTFLIRLLDSTSISIADNFTVIEEENIRQRKYS